MLTDPPELELEELEEEEELELDDELEFDELELEAAVDPDELPVPPQAVRRLRAISTEPVVEMRMFTPLCVLRDFLFMVLEIYRSRQ